MGGTCRDKVRTLGKPKVNLQRFFGEPGVTYAETAENLGRNHGENLKRTAEEKVIQL